MIATENTEGHLGGYVIDQPAPGTWCPKLWDWLIQKHKSSSMLDLGCGLGYVMKYFHERGCEVSGVDGSPSAIQNNQMKPYVHQHDFSVSPWLPDRDYDLIWSSEFLEHVEKKYIDNYMPIFKNTRLFAVVTYALPGQGGHHHVNEQTEDYWIDKFRQQGLTCDKELTLTARSLVPSEGTEGKQFRHKGLVFKQA